MKAFFLIFYWKLWSTVFGKFWNNIDFDKKKDVATDWESEKERRNTSPFHSQLIADRSFSYFRLQSTNHLDNHLLPIQSHLESWISLKTFEIIEINDAPKLLSFHVSPQPSSFNLLESPNLHRLNHKKIEKRNSSLFCCLFCFMWLR